MSKGTIAYHNGYRPSAPARTVDSRTTPHVTDLSGPGIYPAALQLKGRTLSWTVAGARRFARVA